jgi:hypothetical protein
VIKKEVDKKEDTLYAVYKSLKFDLKIHVGKEQRDSKRYSIKMIPKKEQRWPYLHQKK